MIFDRVRLTLTSSDLTQRLRQMTTMGINLENIRQKDFLTASFTIAKKDLPAAEKYLLGKGDRVDKIQTTGPGVMLSTLLHRPLFLLTLLALLTLTLWIPTKVLFIQVAGNHSVPTQHILQSAQNAGIRFGSGVRSVRSERVKNALLAQIPQLQWVGVNTKGCVATITVAERVEPGSEAPQPKIASLVSARDALITEVTVTQGNPLCKPGDVVKKGQVLISGYTDCGIKIQATCAQGEVFGQTIYDKDLIFPTDYRGKGVKIGQSKNIFLQIGKKEIKLWKDSGISGVICDKMYARKFLTLPGGFQLPFGLLVEKQVYYTARPCAIRMEDVDGYMKRSNRLFLTAGMVSGQVLSASESVLDGENFLYLTGHYLCREMVARIHHEEIGTYYEQNSGKNRKR